MRYGGYKTNYHQPEVNRKHNDQTYSWFSHNMVVSIFCLLQDNYIETA